VLATGNTGLAATDVFFWGNRVGDVTSPASGGTFVTNVSSDGGAIVGVAPAGSVGITNRFDVNKTNSINVSGDRGEVVGNAPGSLLRIDIGTGGPFAPEDGDGGGGGGGLATPATSAGDAGISSALAASASASSTPAAVPLPRELVHRLDERKVDRGAIVRYFEQLASEDFPQRRALGAKVAAAANPFALDDELLEVLAGGLLRA
jgi:hypothetical protein